MNERMMNFTNIGSRPHKGSVVRAFLALLFLLILTSCYATTDRLAVFARSVLSQQQVDALSGHYHIIHLDGGFASLSFTPRPDPWSYKQESPRFGSVPFFPQRPQRLAAANMNFKHVLRFDSGDVTTTHIDGVVVFSHIPGTDLILGGVPGETLQMRDEHGNMSPPAGEKNKAPNPFFILRQDGKTMTVKFFSESDEGLKRAFPGIKFSSGLDSTPPLPADKVLAYLKKHAAEAIDEEDAAIYLRSTQQQKERVEQKFNTAVSEKTEKRKAEEVQTSKKANSEAPNFDVTVSAEAARSLRESIRKDDGENEVLQDETSRKQRTATTRNITQGDATSSPPPQNDPTRITSIDGYYLVDKEYMTLIQVQKRLDNGVEEVRLYDKFKARPYGLRHFPRNDYINRGYWYADSQQFYKQALWVVNHGGCGGDWGEMNWSDLYEFSELSVDGKSIKTWAPKPLSLTPTPAGREKKRICTSRRMDANSCSFIRCLKWSDPRNFPNVYLVRSRDDALLIYNEHFGNR